MLKTNVYFEDFCKMFSNNYQNKFSNYGGKRALFGYLEQLSEELGEDIEIDPIALCCEYTEYENFADLKQTYPDIINMEELEDKTIVIPIEGTDRFIIANF